MKIKWAFTIVYLVTLLSVGTAYAESFDCVNCQADTGGRAPAVILDEGATNANEMALMTELIEEVVEKEEASRSVSSTEEADKDLEALEKNIKRTP